MKETQWVSEVTKEGQTFDALADSGDERLQPLDLRLSHALTTMLRHAPAAKKHCIGARASTEDTPIKVDTATLPEAKLEATAEWTARCG